MVEYVRLGTCMRSGLLFIAAKVPPANNCWLDDTLGRNIAPDDEMEGQCGRKGFQDKAPLSLPPKRIEIIQSKWWRVLGVQQRAKVKWKEFNMENFGWMSNGTNSAGTTLEKLINNMER